MHHDTPHAGALSIAPAFGRPPGLPPLPLRTAVLLAALAEAVSWSATRVTLQHFEWDTFEAESIRTALRCVTALIFWLLLRHVITARRPDFSPLRGGALSSAVLLFLLVPLVLHHYTMQPAFAWFFGLMALPVGIKEELLFRGLVQNLLNLRMGQGLATLLCAALATLWHAGVVEHSFVSYTLIFMANVFIGLAYARTGSLLLAIGLHVVYDALFALPSLNGFRFPEPVAMCMLAYAIGMACFGWRRGGLRLPRSASRTG